MADGNASPQVVGPVSPPIQPPQPGSTRTPWSGGPGPSVGPAQEPIGGTGIWPAKLGGPAETPGPVYKPPAGSPSSSPDGPVGAGPDMGHRTPPPVYKPPQGIPPGPTAGPPVGGDPYGSDNWKSASPQSGWSHNQASPTGGWGGTAQNSQQSSTLNPNLQQNAATAKKGTPPIFNPSGGATANASSTQPEYPEKEAERNKQQRRGGTNFGIREQMAKNGVGGYTGSGGGLTS